MSKPDYGLWTFVTSIAILLIQLSNYRPFKYENTPIIEKSLGAEGGPTEGEPHTLEETPIGWIFADREIPHSSYVNVAPEHELQMALDMLNELEKLRIAANTQRAILTAANRMPPETSVSRMIAERTRAYMAEDRARENPVVEASLADLYKEVAMRYANRVGVVLGVGDGRNAVPLLTGWASTFIYLVDPYIHIWRGYDSPFNVDDKTHQMIYESLRYRFTNEFNGKFMFIRDFAHEFAVTYRKAQGQPAPGFVLVDANPAYASVRRDIEAWYPLIQPGGMIAGTLYRNEGDSIGVKRAVDEFARSQNVHVRSFTDHNSKDIIWVIEKPN